MHTRVALTIINIVPLTPFHNCYSKIANPQQKCWALVYHQMRYRFCLSWLPQLQMPEKLLPSVNLPEDGGGWGRWGKLEKLGWGVHPLSKTLISDQDQNLWFSQLYLWPKEKFDTLFKTWGAFLEDPKKFSHPKNISNLLTTELFNPYILITNRGSLHTRSFWSIHLSLSVIAI